VKICSETILYELEYFRCGDIQGDPDMTIGISESIVPVSIFRKKMSAHGSSSSSSSSGSLMVKYTEHLGILGAQFAIKFFSEKV
jgi:hypothetical protein